MADHLVTGLLEVQITCGNLACGRVWRQPGLDPMERLGWIVCPACNTAAPVNVRGDLGTAADPDRSITLPAFTFGEHRPGCDPTKRDAFGLVCWGCATFTNESTPA